MGSLSNEKHKEFCKEYVLDWNGSRAYKVVYKNVTDATARVNASKLLTKANIKEYIEEIQKDLGKLCGVSAALNIQELKKIAFSNFGNLREGWLTLKDFNELSDDDKACISEVTHVSRSTPDGEALDTVKIKLYPKLDAIEKINKMLGFNAPKKIDHTTKGEAFKGLKVSLNDWTDDQIKAEAERLRGL